MIEVSYPSLTIDIEKIKHNTETVVKACRLRNISVVGVTKACCGEPDVARAFADGGVDWIGDSRIQNLARFKTANIDKPMCLLRLPMISEAREVVRLAEMSLVSEADTARALSKEALAAGRRHKVVLMTDMGDLREGLQPQEILQAAMIFAEMPGLELYGLGTNFACYGGVIPTTEKLSALAELAGRIRAQTGCPLPVVSGGNSSSLYLLPEGIPEGITQLRIGEGILLGQETSYRRPVPGTFSDAFRLHCEVIELQNKPSMPDGLIGTDAFGRSPVFEDKGIRRRAIAAIGRHDVIVEGLIPADAGAVIIGASSDHLLLDVTEVERPLAVGSILKFEMQYSALISGMMSSYVSKVIGRGF